MKVAPLSEHQGCSNTVLQYKVRITDTNSLIKRTTMGLHSFGTAALRESFFISNFHNSREVRQGKSPSVQQCYEGTRKSDKSGIQVSGNDVHADFTNQVSRWWVIRCIQALQQIKYPGGG